mmetsp:Transcript_7115/g.10611  ORF Transcript_7115/g.10611 Transcript_7115/m.10611 type:complete len:263 (+) Transcript_7115:151-939(+)
MFSGDFDNYEQVLIERRRGQSSKDTDGHEHVHCSLRWLDTQVAKEISGYERCVVACYYLDADPQNIFRLRLYAFDDSIMRLYRPQDIKKAHSLCTNFPCKKLDELAHVCRCISWQYLEYCDIHWQESAKDEEISFRGSMPNGGCTLPSQYNPNRFVVIKDDLMISFSGLRVNDRGYDKESGKLIYGSENGIPYDLRRLSKNNDLSWTLGPAFRTAEHYSKMLAPLSLASSSSPAASSSQHQKDENEKCHKVIRESTPISQGK